ncbi:MAG TPA: esterase [Firmicutes bacterium]|nr:esterase [Bacillota bacterium]
MALIHCHFHSDVLGLSTSMYVILPQAAQRPTKMKGALERNEYSTLYLLHGLSEDHTTWLRKTAIERYVAQLELAVVMPEVQRSFYTDMSNGSRYWTFISEELPEILQSLFGLSALREKNFVTGLSMGGYGAFKLALAKPEKFSAAASLSGVLDVVHWSQKISAREKMEWRNIFGDLEQLAGSENDLFFLAQNLVTTNKPLPKLYQCCGTEDFLYETNERFTKLARELRFDLTYEEGPGEHRWEYWDQMIRRVLEWLPLKAKIF